MLIRRSRYGTGNIRPSEITGKSAYLNRREFLSLTAAGTLAATVPALYSPIANAALNFSNIKKTDYRVDEKITDKKSVTTYNNFYEFGTDKGDPARNSGDFKPLPWTVKVGGACDKPGDYALEDFVSPHQLEDRVYRFRCVEAWSMVIPWVGIPLADVLKRFEPNSKAKYVSFRTVFRPEEMPGQKRSYIPWPYVEGLRIDEAMNPLALLAV
ncbi:MAG: sulfoxide reductase catalytic subunit YedY, partial [Gammaproteobacteria bacterium]